jgi:fructan beta-fructosidase
MTVPTQLSLVQTPRGLRLRAWPIAELDNLRATTHALQPRMLDTAIALTDTTDSTPMPCEIEAEFDVSPGAATVVGVELINSLGDVYRVGFDAARNVYFSDRRRAGNVGFSDAFASTVHEGARATTHPTARMRLLFDVASAELFADDGEVLMTDTFFPTEVFTSARIFCDGAPVPLLGGRVHALRPTPVERQRPAAPDHERTEKI